MAGVKSNRRRKRTFNERASFTWQQMKASRQLYILVLPFFILFFTFTVLPVVASILISFTHFNMTEFPQFVGWHNYIRLFVDDDVFLIALRNTFLFAAFTGPLSYLLCFVFAWMINELSPKFRAIMTLVFYAPSISGNVYFIWAILFSPDAHGYANSLLMRLGLIYEPVRWLLDPAFILPVLILVQLWLSLGVGFLAFIAGLQGIDRTQYEAGAVDGIRNRWQELWYITLPNMKSILMFGAVIQITASFAVADVATSLAGFPSVEYAAHTVVTHMMDFGTIRFEMGYASAIATLLFLAMIGTNLLIKKLLSKVGE